MDNVPTQPTGSSGESAQIVAAESLRDIQKFYGTLLPPLYAVFAAATCLTAALALNGPSEGIEQPLWALSTCIAVPAGLAVGIRLANAPTSPLALRRLLTVVSPLIVCSAIWLRFVGDSTPAYAAICASLVLLLLSVASGGMGARAWEPKKLWASRVPDLVIITCAVTLAALFLNPARLTTLDLVIAIIVSGSALCYTVVTWESLGRTGRLIGTNRVCDLCVILLILLVVPIFPAVTDPMTVHHQSFYLAPTSDVLQGKAVLSDTWSQYGTGLFYLLALVFKIIPIGYGGMALLLIILTVLATFGMYAAMRLAGVQAFIAALAIVAVIAVQVIGQDGAYTAVPSTGPLRFGLPLAIILVSLLGHRFPKWRKVVPVLQLLIVAISALTGFEACFYTVFTLFGLNLVSQLAQGADGWRGLFLRTIGSLGIALGTLILFTLITWLFEGSVSWRPYLEFLQLYSAGGFGTIPLSWFTAGGLVASLIIASTAAALYIALQRSSNVSSSTLLGLGGFNAAAIAEFTYFVGRSHPNNLSHLAPVVIALGAVWVSLLVKVGAHRRLRFLGIAIATLTCSFAATGAVAAQKSKLSQTAAALLIPLGDGSLRNEITRLLRQPIADPRAVEGAQIVVKEQEAGHPVALIATGELSTEIRLISKSKNELALSNLSQDVLSPTLRKRACESAGRLPPRTVMILDLRGFETNPAAGQFAAEMRRCIERYFRLEPSATTPTGLMVFDLRRRTDVSPSLQNSGR